ncbi:uncharacterized protein ARMOST_03985 [Armillaria ostoyae]|uniref:Uncharacterized protein n=1 Tax=Armillaria ostoyae TaxID=47428 RepID=A0A284QW48_ARMOS|nr:uncharacterized protein ARMOST_03985 [Armillaria ostoyae]
MSSNGISSVNVGVVLGGTTSMLACLGTIQSVKLHRGGSAKNGGRKVTQPTGGPKSGGQTADSRGPVTNGK